jgi:hypothetical protein
MHGSRESGCAPPLAGDHRVRRSDKTPTIVSRSGVLLNVLGWMPAESGPNGNAAVGFGLNCKSFGSSEQRVQPHTGMDLSGALMVKTAFLRTFGILMKAYT